MDTFFNLSSTNDASSSDINITRSDKIVLYIDIITTRIWAYSNFLLYVFILAYNIFHLFKSPQSAPPKIFITFQLFFICTIYSLTYMLPLFQPESDLEKAQNTFPQFYIYNIASPICYAQAIFHSTTLLGMLGINLCITINCYFSFYKKELSKNVEVLICLAAWIIPLIVCLFSLLDKSILIDANMICWPENQIWRIIYDFFLCSAYLANLIVFGLIIIRVYKIDSTNKWKYIRKIWLQGLILITLSLYFYDFAHSLVVNMDMVVNPKTDDPNNRTMVHEESTPDTKENSNIANVWFVMFNDYLGLLTGNILVFVYKPRFPRVLCCKEKVQGELPDFGDNETEKENENANELMDIPRKTFTD